MRVGRSVSVYGVCGNMSESAREREFVCVGVCEREGEESEKIEFRTEFTRFQSEMSFLFLFLFLVFGFWFLVFFFLFLVFGFWFLVFFFFFVVAINYLSYTLNLLN